MWLWWGGPQWQHHLHPSPPPLPGKIQLLHWWEKELLILHSSLMSHTQNSQNCYWETKSKTLALKLLVKGRVQLQAKKKKSSAANIYLSTNILDIQFKIGDNSLSYWFFQSFIILIYHNPWNTFKDNATSNINNTEQLKQ